MELKDKSDSMDSARQSADFNFQIGPCRDARDHIRSRLPWEAFGRCVEFLVLLIARRAIGPSWTIRLARLDQLAPVEPANMPTSTAEDNMNVQLKDITVTARDGRVSHLDQVYIRGSHVRFFIVPDMLRYVDRAIA
jgi:hypothetical protein